MKNFHGVFVGLFIFGCFLVFGVKHAQAAVSYRSSAAICNATANTAVSVPGGTVNGDVMVMVINSKDNAVQAIPSGWTRIGTQVNNTTSLTTNIFYRVASSEPVSYSPTTTGVSHCLAIASFIGADNAAPINTFSQSANATSNTVTAAAITPTIANTEVLFISGYARDATYSGYSGTNPTFTERYDAATLTGTHNAIALASGLKTDNTSTGSRTANATGVASVNNGYLIALAPAINISGTCKQADGTTNCTDTGTIRVAVNGVLQPQTQTIVSGTWTISGVSKPLSGAVITVFVDGVVSSASRAVAVTTYSGNGDINGLELMEGALSLGNSDNRTITNTDLSQYDNSVSGDADVFYDVNGANLIVDNNNSITDELLYIKSGNTFAPGGNVTTASYKNSGTFTASTNLVTFTAASGNPTISGNLNSGNAFYKVTFDTGSTGSASWTIKDAMKISAANATDTVVIKYGTVTMGDGSGDNLEVSGKMVIAGTAGEIGTFQTPALASGSITIDINANTSTPTCANCIISVGATSGAGQGNFKIAKNTILRLNPRSTATASDTGIEVESTGYLQILGSQETTNTVSSISQNTLNTTITVSGAPWTTGQFDGMHIRFNSGKIFSLSNTTTNTVQLNALTTSTDTNPDVVGSLACSGGGTCMINVADSLFSATGDQVGNYLHNITQNKYYLIAATTESATDTIGIISNSPDSFTTMNDGDDIEITEGIRVGDTFGIIDYATVTAESGVPCTSATNEAGEAYIYAKAGSETLIRYADICNLGRGTAGKFGINFDSINGANPSEGITVDTSRIRKGLKGVLLVNSAGNKGNKGIINNSVENNLDAGIYLNGSSDNAILNNVSFSNLTGVLLENTNKTNTIDSNKTYRNISHGIAIISSSSNKITGNTIYYNGSVYDADHGLYLSSNSKNNIIDSNSSFNNATSGIMVALGSSNTTISNNGTFNNRKSGIVVEPSYNSIFNNNSFNNATNGLTIACPTADDPTQVLFGNSFYLNQGVGLKLESGFDCLTTSINDNFGSSGGNVVADLGMGKGGAITPGDHKMVLLNPTLGSATSTSFSEVANVNAYAISRKHNGVSGGTAVWGKYSVPSNDSETPQNEGIVKFNYTDNLWEKSASHHGYWGTGTEDTNLDYDLSTSNLASGPYHYRLTVKTAGNCGTAVFDVFRQNVDVGDATCGTQFTDGTSSVKFKVDGGGTIAYVVGDSYTFNVWNASSNINTQKSITMMQDKDTFTVPSGTTLELKGQSAGVNVTQVTRGGSGGYQFIVSGTIDANAYQFDYLGGTSQTAGLLLNSGATVTSLSNGGFNNASGAAATRKITYTARPAGVDNIYIMNEDGTGVTQLTNTAYNDHTPEWSHDGSKIVFNRDFDGQAIYSMNANGSNVVRLSGSAANDMLPDWSPNGTKIVYTHVVTPNIDPNLEKSTINIMDANGTNVITIFDNNSFNMAPRWSPDGTKIIFMCGPFNGGVQICIMDSNGTNMVQLTNVLNSNHGDPHWSYDGTKIAFGSTREGDGTLDVYTMNANGTNVQMIVDFDTPNEGGDIGWSQDGKKLTFERDINGNFQSDPTAYADVWEVNSDGTGLVNTGQVCSGVGCGPRWQPNTAVAQPTNFDLIQVNSSLIGSGIPQKTISSLKFENVKGSANCNLNVIGTVSGYWELLSSTGSFSGETYDCKNGTVDATPGNFKWTP